MIPSMAIAAAVNSMFLWAPFMLWPVVSAELCRLAWEESLKSFDKPE